MATINLQISLHKKSIFLRKFSIESTSKKAVLVLRKTLDYDGGERLFNITIKAQVRVMN